VTGKASDPRWELYLFIDGTGYIAADSSGKKRFFGTVDQAAKFAASVIESPDGKYLIDVRTDEYFASHVPADIYGDAERRIVTLNKVKSGLVDKVAAIDVLLAGPMVGWDTGNAAQQEAFNQKTLQKTTMVEEQAAITARVADLQAVVDSQP
jgi:hypothetical protein